MLITVTRMHSCTLVLPLSFAPVRPISFPPSCVLCVYYAGRQKMEQEEAVIRSSTHPAPQSCLPHHHLLSLQQPPPKEHKVCLTSHTLFSVLAHSPSVCSLASGSAAPDMTDILIHRIAGKGAASKSAAPPKPEVVGPPPTDVEFLARLEALLAMEGGLDLTDLSLAEWLSMVLPAPDASPQPF